MLVAIGVAAAYTPAGYGVPEPCGALAGPAEDGALGMCHNPAAAHPERDEWLLDVAVLASALQYRLDWTGETVASSGASPVPGLAFAVPAGPVGFGFAFLPLYVRGGGEPAAADAPQRFYSYEGSIRVLAGDLSVAVAPHPAWTVGASLRVAQGEVRSRRAIDAGALVAGIAGPDAGVPVGDPFLEGTQSLLGLQGVGFGGAVGARWSPERGPTVALAVHAPLRLTLEGPLSLVPSNYLEMELTGTVATTMVFPPAVFLAVAVPVGAARVGADVSWIGWSSMERYSASLDGVRITSDDATMQSLFDAYGVTEAEFLASAEDAITVTGMRDVVNAGVSARAPLGRVVEVGGGVWVLPAAVPDETVHPANLDFASLDLRGTVAWNPSERVTLGLGVDLYPSADRAIEDSAHDWVSPGEGGSALPSGEGLYELFLARAGLTLVWRSPFARRSGV
ncbi:MAG: hypothetical protein ACOZNI_14585 [Myxococcota bacterium]